MFRLVPIAGRSTIKRCVANTTQLCPTRLTRPMFALWTELCPEWKCPGCSIALPLNEIGVVAHGGSCRLSERVPVICTALVAREPRVSGTMFSALSSGHIIEEA